MIAVGAPVGAWRVVRALRPGVVIARSAGAAGFDERSESRVGGDPAGSAGGAGVRPRGIEKLVEIRTVTVDGKAFDAWAARAAKERVEHPNLVALLDAGRTADGDAYVVTEHVPGATVAELLDKRVELPKPVLARIAADLAEAYDAIAAAGHAFAGVTPDDVIVGADGRARLSGYWAGGIGAATPGPASPTNDAIALAMVLIRFPDKALARAREAEKNVTRAGVAGPESPAELAARYGTARATPDEVAAVVRAAVGERLDEVDAEVAATEDLFGAEAEPADPDAPPFLDDNVQFTVYRPRSITPGRW